MCSKVSRYGPTYNLYTMHKSLSLSLAGLLYFLQKQLDNSQMEERVFYLAPVRVNAKIYTYAFTRFTSSATKLAGFLSRYFFSRRNKTSLSVAA